MIVLGIETATTDVAVAIVDEDGLRSGLSARARRNHVELLHPMVTEACRLAGLDLAELGGIAVDVGPGLFTGIRVGIAAAQGFSIALDIPVAAVTSLEALTAALGPVLLAGAAVAPLVDLRRGEVAFSFTAPSSEPTPPTKAPPAAAARRLAELAAAHKCALVCCGEGALCARGDLDNEASQHGVDLFVAGAELRAPGAVSVATEGLSKLLSGCPEKPSGPEPVYLREPDARINWSKMRR